MTPSPKPGRRDEAVFEDAGCQSTSVFFYTQSLNFRVNGPHFSRVPGGRMLISNSSLAGEDQLSTGLEGQAD